MNLQEIKAAVAAGKAVYWNNERYTVKGDMIVDHSGGRAIGLTGLDGATLNGKECEFFVCLPYVVQVNHAVVLRTGNIGEVARYLNVNGLVAASNIRGPFKRIALSADGDAVCGFLFNNGVESTIPASAWKSRPCCARS